MPTITTAATGFQKLYGFYGNGNGATYTVTVTATSPAAMRKFDVLRRPVRGGMAAVVGTGGSGSTVTTVETGRSDFELEVWADVTTAGAFAVTVSNTAETDVIALATFAKDAQGNVTGLARGTGNIPLNRGAQSCMWLGDSLTQYGKQQHPFVAARTMYSFVAVGGSYIRLCQTIVNTPGGNGTLAYNRQRRTMTWASNGNSAGTAVDVSTGGFFRLTDSAGYEILIGVSLTNEPTADTNTTVTVPTITGRIESFYTDGFTGWTEALLGFPFGEASYNYGLSGSKASEVWGYRAQWQDVPTDITTIHLGTNDITAMADVTPTIAHLRNIIQARQRAGSRCVVGLLFPQTSSSVAVRQAYVAYNARLRSLCDSLGVDCFDGSKAVMDPSSTTVFAIDTTCYQSDNLHLNGKGAYKVANYALVPILSKYVRQKALPLYAGAPYDATLVPDGNLITNGVLIGTGGVVSVGSGTLATSWTQERSTGAAIVSASAAPDGAGPSRTDGQTGKYQRFVVSGALVDGETIRIRSAAISGTNWAVGDVVVLSGDIRISSATGLAGLKIFANTDKGFAYAVDGTGTTVPLGDLNGDTVSFRFESMPLSIPTGTTTLDVRVQISTLTGGGVTVDLGQQISLRKLI